MYGRAVSDLSVPVLQAMYQITAGDTNLPVPVSPALESRVQDPALIDTLNDLVHRGLIRSEPPNLVFLTPNGVRAMFIGLAYEARQTSAAHESQDLPIEAPDETEDEDEMDLGSIMDLVRESKSRPRGESGVRPSPARDSAPAMERIDLLQQTLDALTQDLALNAEFSLPQWTQALELRAEMGRLLETIRRLVQPRPSR